MAAILLPGHLGDKTHRNWAIPNTRRDIPLRRIPAKPNGAGRVRRSAMRFKRGNRWRIEFIGLRPPYRDAIARHVEKRNAELESPAELPQKSVNRLCRACKPCAGSFLHQPSGRRISGSHTRLAPGAARTIFEVSWTPNGLQEAAERLVTV